MSSPSGSESNYTITASPPPGVFSLAVDRFLLLLKAFLILYLEHLPSSTFLRILLVAAAPLLLFNNLGRQLGCDRDFKNKYEINIRLVQWLYIGTACLFAHSDTEDSFSTFSCSDWLMYK